MRLIDLAAVYLVIGLVCTVVTARRASRPIELGLGDAALTLFVWPLYVPVLLGRPSPGEPGDHGAGSAHAAIRREEALLLEALGGVADPTIAGLLPTSAQIVRLVEHLVTLDAKVAELDQVLGRREFDSDAAERTRDAAERRGGPALESARRVCESIRRLVALRERAAGERDELLALCAQLRTQVTVVRFTGAEERGDVGELAGEILARIEGVDAALEPRLAEPFDAERGSGGPLPAREPAAPA